VSVISYYDEDTTKESREELKTFVEYMNKTYGNYPIVIGGWAVHSYTNGEMSQDIDILIYDEATYSSKIEDEYLPQHNFIHYNKGTEEAFFGKPIMGKDGQPKIIQFDTILADQKQTIPELDIVKDWSLTIEHRKKVSLDDLKIYIPTRELLIVQKIIAALERTKDLKYETRSQIIDRLTSKIKKDYLDIASLIKVGPLNKEQLQKFYQVSKLEPHLDSFIAGYDREDYEDIFRRANITSDEIKQNLIP